MNESSLFITGSAVILTIVSAIFNLTGRQRYKDNAAFFESSNHELREQNTSFRNENTALKTQLVKSEAASAQKDKVIEQLKPFTDVIKTMSDNHKTVMAALANITIKITGKIDGR